MKNPNIKYYKIPSKSQSPNPNAYRDNFKIPKIPTSEKIGSIEIWDLFGSIGMYWDLGFPKSYANTGGAW
ncbi:MAG: hypothetical protein QMD80_05460 [archaeon]|nr:hypothetical protein [archaeon]